MLETIVEEKDIIWSNGRINIVIKKPDSNVKSRELCAGCMNHNRKTVAANEGYFSGSDPEKKVTRKKNVIQIEIQLQLSTVPNSAQKLLLRVKRQCTKIGIRMSIVMKRRI